MKNETVIYIIYSSQNFFLLKVINAIYVLTTNYLSADSKEMGRYFFTSVQQMFSNLNKQYDTYGVIPVGIVKKWMDFFHDILQKLQTIFTMFYKFVFKKAHVPIIVEKEKTLRSRYFNFYQVKSSGILVSSGKHTERYRGRIQRKTNNNFSCMFLNPNNFFPIWILIVLIN